MKPAAQRRFIALLTLTYACFLSVDANASPKSRDQFLDALVAVKRETVYEQPIKLAKLKEQYPKEFSPELWAEMEKSIDYRLNEILQKYSSKPNFGQVIEKVYAAKLHLDPKAVPDLLSQSLHDLDSASSAEVREKLFTALLKFDSVPDAIVRAANETRKNSSAAERLLAEAIAHQGKTEGLSTLSELYPFAKKVNEVSDPEVRTLVLQHMKIDEAKFKAIQRFSNPSNGTAGSFINELQERFHFQLSDLNVMPLKDRALFGAYYYNSLHGSKASPDWKLVKGPIESEWNEFLKQTDSELNSAIQKQVRLNSATDELKDLYRIKVELAQNRSPEVLSEMIKALPSLDVKQQNTLLSELANAKKLPDDAWSALSKTVTRTDATNRGKVKLLVMKRFNEIPEAVKAARSEGLASILLGRDFLPEELEAWLQLVPENQKFKILGQRLPEIFARTDLFSDGMMMRVVELMNESPEVRDEFMPVVIRAFAEDPTVSKPYSYFFDQMQTWLHEHPGSVVRYSHDLDRIFSERILDQLRRNFDFDQMKVLIRHASEFTSAEGYRHLLAIAEKELKQTTTQARKAVRERMLNEVTQMIRAPMNISFDPDCIRGLLKDIL